MVPVHFRVLASLGRDRDEQLRKLRWLMPRLLALRKGAIEEGIDLQITLELDRSD